MRKGEKEKGTGRESEAAGWLLRLESALVAESLFLTPSLSHLLCCCLHHSISCCWNQLLPQGLSSLSNRRAEGAGWGSAAPRHRSAARSWLLPHSGRLLPLHCLLLVLFRFALARTSSCTRASGPSWTAPRSCTRPREERRWATSSEASTRNSRRRRRARSNSATMAASNNNKFSFDQSFEPQQLTSPVKNIASQPMDCC